MFFYPSIYGRVESERTLGRVDCFWIVPDCFWMVSGNTWVTLIHSVWPKQIHTRQRTCTLELDFDCSHTQKSHLETATHTLLLEDDEPEALRGHIMESEERRKEKGTDGENTL